MNYTVWSKFFIIWENSKIEQYTINWFYNHIWTNKETNLEEIKYYYVYQKWDIIMTIGENYMYKDLEKVIEKAIELLNKETEKIETIKKDILQTNF